MYICRWEGTPQKEFLHKKLCLFLMFNLQLCSVYFPLTQYTYQGFFPHHSKQFLNSLILMLFSASAIFLFHLFHIGKLFPFEDFFIWVNQKNVTWGKITWVEKVGHGVMPFLVKSCWTLRAVWAGTLVNHPWWNEQMCWVIKKIH